MSNGLFQLQNRMLIDPEIGTGLFREYIDEIKIIKPTFFQHPASLDPKKTESA